RRRDQEAEVRARRHGRAAELRLDERPPGLRADRRDPATPLLDRIAGEHEIVEDGADLPRLEQPDERRPGGVAGLLHPAEKDHLERRQDRRAALLERAAREWAPR